MGAETTYYVTGYVLVEKIREVSAITADDAKAFAELDTDIVKVTKVQHWSEVEVEEE